MAEKSGGGIDTSFYGRATEPPNMLQQAATLVGIQNALQAGQIQQQQIQRFGAEQTAGQQFLQAINPTTGMVDTNKLGGLLRANPSLGIVAPQMLQNQQSLQGGQISNQGGQIANERSQTDLNITRRNQVAQGLMGLVAKPDLSAQDAVNYVKQLSRSGVLNEAQANQHLQEIAGIGNNRSALANYIYGHYATTAGANAIQPATVGVTAQGQPIQGLQGANVRATQSPQAATTTGAKPSMAAPGGVVTTLAPGDVEARSKTAQAGAEQGIKLQGLADGVPTRKGMLANLQDDLDHFTSGPGADWTKVAKSALNRNVLPTGMQFDPQSIASQEAFEKQATQLAQQQFSALGGTGTDSQLSSAFKSNPNSALSQLGNQQIINLLKGNEDAIAAKAQAWQEWQKTKGPADYAGFQAEFNKTYNPRVYQAMYMTPAQINDMRKNMSPAEQQQFARDYLALKQKGYISPGGR
ncbi:hypothetical protein [Methylobacterium sp. yr596]|uniref:hypothetical protein n=1 Tax=Methylobacterium sp. yr596 TaxID=1761800 RepID=UPI0008EF6460|nr:hypothetical protein [Methylobacterium sp. yr596]SFF76675.1 hypothetical protein SAMN04487844_1478 [Methylobacterium sp. yr596]